MQFLFGSGVFWGTPLNDAYGNVIANPTPIQLGVMQDVSIDISFDSKELYGQNQFPVAVGRGKGKITGKSKVAQVSGAAISSLIFGQAYTNGIVSNVNDITGEVIPASPYTVTPTPPGSGTFSYDLGVKNANGLPLTRVSGTPTTGQYAMAAGVYTFAAADTGTTVFISYQYTATSTTAKQATVLNVPMGYAPVFKGDLYVPYQGKSLIITIPNCLSSKFTIATKQDDFAIPEFDFTGFADSAGHALYWATTE